MKDRVLIFTVVAVVLTGGALFLQGWRSALFTLLGCLLVGGLLLLAARFLANKG
jgi:hypothetical protein